MWNFLRTLLRTEPKHHEAKLRLSQEPFRLLVEGIQEYAILMLDPEGQVTTWNAGASRIKGYSAEEIIGRNFSCFYPPEDVAVGKPARELKLAASSGKYEEEGWRLRKDGSRFWASVVITALKDEAGHLRGFAKVTRDLSERRKAEENARRLFEEETARRAAESNAREARLAQQEERRQREQLRVTLSSIGDAVIVTDTHGVVTFLNPVAQSLTGWSPQEAAGQPLERVFQIVNEETRRSVENPVSKVLREGVIVGLANHTVLITRDGRETQIDDSAAPIRGEEGTVAGVVLVFRDVTEVRRAVQARLHLAAIVESSDDAIIGHDLDGIITSWNQGAVRMYGYSAEEMIGKPLSLLVPPDHLDEAPALLERIRRGERIDHFETVRQRKDGSRFDVSVTTSPIKNGEDRIIGASKIARDISASKRNEAALWFLAEASKLLAELLDVPSTLQKVAGLAVPHFADWCAVDLLAEDGSLQRMAVAHVDPAKVELAHELYRRFPPDPAAPLGAWNVVRTGKSEHVPDIALLQETTKDEELRRILRDLGLRSYMAVPLTLRGRMQGVITFVAAESGRRFEPGDLRSAEDLAQRAAIAIENARLYADLKEADQRKDEFLAMLAHELRNPLAPIRNAVHLLRLPGASPETTEQARQMIERQTHHLVRLVDDLLDVSRIMQGKIDLRKQPVELAAVIAQAVETAQPVIDAQGHQLIVSVASEPLWLEGDAARLAQVVGNLIHNAAKFSARAGRVWLTAERQGNEAVVRVRDEGPGIGADLLPRIFDLFVQGDRSLERSSGGLGIGLTVVQRLVELHGGKITAHSEGPGKGSEFEVRLPALEEAPGQELGGASYQPMRATDCRRILVVDDNVDVAESVAMVLRLSGHDVRLAYSGPEALEAAQAYQPEVILLDIGLPGMTGYEVAQRLRQQRPFQRTLFVAVTGYGQGEDKRRSQESGFDHHLTKPVDPEVIMRLLAEWSFKAI
jgi:PAS domain S-box-containing protein